MGTFHSLHPEVLDLWVSVKYDDPKNKALVEDEIRELLRIRRKVKVEGARQLRDIRTRLTYQALGEYHRRPVRLHGRRFQCRAHGRRGRRDEYHAGLSDETREIGVRKAIGATKMTILTQFTTEAITLCAVGGVIGVLLGAVLTYIVYFLPIGLPATISTIWVIIGFGVSCTIGLLLASTPPGKPIESRPNRSFAI